MADNIYQSPHKGRVIDQAVKDTISLKERVGQVETDILSLDTNKADKNTVPKSFKDLEPNASLVYKGIDEPPTKYDIWFYPQNDTKYIIKIRNNNGAWVDVVSIDKDQIHDIVIEELTLAKESGDFDGEDGYTPQKGTDYWTDEDKAEIKADIEPFIVNVEVASDGTVTPDCDVAEMVTAYKDGKTVLAYVTEGTESGVITTEENTNVLTLVNVDRVDATDKLRFTNIDRLKADTYQATYLWYEGEVTSIVTGETTEMWKIETVSLPSKEYVDEQIGDATPFVVTGSMEYNLDNSTYEFENMSATYEEVKTAYEQGKDVILKITHEGDTSYMNMSCIDSDEWLIFKSYTVAYAPYNDKREHTQLNVWCETDGTWHSEGILLANVIYVEETTGYLEELTTTDKTNLVAAINDVNANKADTTYVDEQIGDIETALDGIIAIQNQLMEVSE